MFGTIRGTFRGLAAALALFAVTEGIAEDQNGLFDFYLLSLSWSPSFCESRSENRRLSQCHADADHGFVVHGLWPQFERGYPEFCDTDHPQRLPLSLIETMLDIMPSVGLVGGQWRKHGTCSGLAPSDYLATVRRAREGINIPSLYATADEERFASAAAIEDAFVAANPGLTREGIALSCRDGRLREVRICMTPALAFRSCRAVDRRGCRSRRLRLPESE